MLASSLYAGIEMEMGGHWGSWPFRERRRATVPASMSSRG